MVHTYSTKTTSPLVFRSENKELIGGTRQHISRNMFRAPLRAVKVCVTRRAYEKNIAPPLYTFTSQALGFSVTPTLTFKNVKEKADVTTPRTCYFRSSVDQCTYECDLGTRKYTKLADSRFNVSNVRDVYEIWLREKNLYNWTVVELATDNNFNIFALGGNIVPSPLITGFHYFGHNYCVADTMDKGVVILDTEANVLFKHENPTKTYEYGGMLNGTHLFHEGDITFGVQIR